MEDRRKDGDTIDYCSVFLSYQQTDSVLLWVCTVIDHRRRENAAALCTLALFDVIRDLLANRRTTIWNLFFAVFTIKIETLFFFFNEIQSKGNIGKQNRINWFIFRFGKILRNLSLKSCTQDEKFEVFPFFNLRRVKCSFKYLWSVNFSELCAWNRIPLCNPLTLFIWDNFFFYA